MEERNGTWNTPYLFNGKELDEETGLYYYGARYLNPTSAVWLSVDPKFEDYVGVTPYSYCLDNPVKLVDPDGKVPWIAVAAIIGGAVNATIAICDGKSTSEVVAAGLGGAVAGALMACGGIGMGVLGGVVGNVVEQASNVIVGNKTINSKDDLTDVGIGLIVSGAVGGVANGVGNVVNSKLATKALDKLNKAKNTEILSLKGTKSEILKEHPELKIKKGGDPNFKQKKYELEKRAHNEVEISQWNKERKVQSAQTEYEKWSNQMSKGYETCTDALQNFSSRGLNSVINDYGE